MNPNPFPGSTEATPSARGGGRSPGTSSARCPQVTQYATSNPFQVPATGDFYQYVSSKFGNDGDKTATALRTTFPMGLPLEGYEVRIRWWPPQAGCPLPHRPPTSCAEGGLSENCVLFAFYGAAV